MVTVKEDKKMTTYDVALYLPFTLGLALYYLLAAIFNHFGWSL